MVSDSSITGAKNIIDKNRKEYFFKDKKMNLNNPTIVRFTLVTQKLLNL